MVMLMVIVIVIRIIPMVVIADRDLHHLCGHGPLARCVKLRVAHAPGMFGTFSPPPRVSDPDMHHGTCVMHVPWCMPGSLTSGFFWSRWQGKRSRHSRSMSNPKLYASGKRPMVMVTVTLMVIVVMIFIVGIDITVFVIIVIIIIIMLLSWLSPLSLLWSLL